VRNAFVVRCATRLWDAVRNAFVRCGAQSGNAFFAPSSHFVAPMCKSCAHDARIGADYIAAAKTHARAVTRWHVRCRST
jgi:hypothetical protein